MINFQTQIVIINIFFRSYFLIRIDAKNINFYTHPIIAVKLASQSFTLETLSERRHLTNVAIQQKYKNSTSSKLPDNHMMTLERLNQYFSEIGHPNLYYEKIYPSMKRTLTLLSQASIADIEHQFGRFEIFGIDWMIGEDFSTQLIEINRSPSMESYTVVSTIVLNVILEDLIKGRF